MKRKASVQCQSAGAVGFLSLFVRTSGGRLVEHEAHGAKVKIVTDRHSGLEVEFLNHHKTYRQGDRLICNRDDFKMGLSAEMIAGFSVLRQEIEAPTPKRVGKKTRT